MLTFFINTTILLTYLFLLDSVLKMKEFNKYNALWVESDAVSKVISLDAGFVSFDLYTHDRE